MPENVPKPSMFLVPYHGSVRAFEINILKHLFNAAGQKCVTVSFVVVTVVTIQNTLAVDNNCMCYLPAAWPVQLRNNESRYQELSISKDAVERPND